MSLSHGKPKVAFQGERGAFSEEAAVKLLGPDIELVPCPTFPALFRIGDDGGTDYVLAPVENTLIGPIQAAVDLLKESSFMTVGDVSVRIEHHLIGCRGSILKGIKTVESHPAALAQCRRFFVEHPEVQCVEAEDTAGSVRRIVELGDIERAAIAGRRAAELYGGTILRENLEDSPANYTRFVLFRTSGARQVAPNRI